MNLVVLTLGLILGSGQVCFDCEEEFWAMTTAQNIYDEALTFATAAEQTYQANPTDENYGAWVGALTVLLAAEMTLDNAMTAYSDCMLETGGGPIFNAELMSSTRSILDTDITQ